MSGPRATDGARVLARFEARERGTNVLYGVCGGIWVMTLFAPPTAADMRLALGSLTAARRLHPGGFPTLSWVLRSAGYRMDDEARQAAAELTTRFASSIRGEATIIEGTGFQAAAVRGIVAGLEALSRAPGEKKVFADVLPAVSWCLARCPEPRATGSPNAAEITETLIAARATWCHA